MEMKLQSRGEQKCITIVKIREWASKQKYKNAIPTSSNVQKTWKIKYFLQQVFQWCSKNVKQ